MSMRSSFFFFKYLSNPEVTAVFVAALEGNVRMGGAARMMDKRRDVLWRLSIRWVLGWFISVEDILVV